MSRWYDHMGTVERVRAKPSASGDPVVYIRADDSSFVFDFDSSAALDAFIAVLRSWESDRRGTELRSRENTGEGGPAVALDDAVAELSVAIDDKLSQGREDYGQRWTDEEPRYHWRRFEEETMEFRQATEHYGAFDDSLTELADVINFGLFYALTAEHEREGRWP